jgi:hypothetical protein
MPVTIELTQEQVQIMIDALKFYEEKYAFLSNHEANLVLEVTMDLEAIQE